MSSIFIDFHNKEIRGPDHSYHLMDVIMLIVKQRERYLICFPEIVDLKGGITRSDSYEFYVSFRVLITFYDLIQFVDRRSLLLTERSVHTENFDNYHLSFNIRNGEFSAARKAKVIAIFRLLRYLQFHRRQNFSCLWNRIIGNHITMHHENNAQDYRH